MKKLLAHFFLLPFLVFADKWTDSATGIEWEYTVTNGRATVGNDDRAAISSATAGAISIPSILGGCPVTCVGWEAFRDCSRLTSVTIPNGVTRISNVAFSGCRGLKSVTIPNSMRYIGYYSFGDCKSMASLKIPAGLIHIDTRALWGCDSLTEIAVAAGNRTYSSLDGVLYNATKTELIRCPEGKSGIFTIPSGVTRIGEFAFLDCTGWKSIEIPSSVMYIEREAFWNCSGLSTITIPQGVLSIGSGAFGGCSGLSVVSIPSSVTDIDELAFHFSENLTTITVAADNTAYSSHDGILYNKARTELIECPSGKAGLVTIPMGVASIGTSAFNQCRSLTSVVMPENVTKIGVRAFGWCSRLTCVTIPTTVTSVDTNAFCGCSSLKTMHVTGGGDVDAVKGLLSESGLDVAKLTFIQSVTFDGNGGTPALAEMSVTNNAAIGELPTVRREHYEFLGWFTSKHGGSLVTEQTVVMKDVTYYAHWRIGQLPKVSVELVGANASSETNGCTVTGDGAYLPGKKVTLRATAATAKKATAKSPAQIATVFAGWYGKDARGTIASTCVSLVPSYSFVMPTNDVMLYAKFIAQTSDVAAVSVALPTELTNRVTTVNAVVDVSGCSSLATVKVRGLPSGLKFTSKLVTSKVTTGSGKDKVSALVTNALPNTIYGTPTKSGVYTVIVTATTVGKATATETFNTIFPIELDYMRFRPHVARHLSPQIFAST